MNFHIFASVTFLYVSKTKSISSRERLLCGKWSETAEAQQVPGKKEAACPVKWDMPPLSVYRGLRGTRLQFLFSPSGSVIWYRNVLPANL